MFRNLASKHNTNSKCVIFETLENICAGIVHFLCGELEETWSINIEERGHQSLSPVRPGQLIQVSVRANTAPVEQHNTDSYTVQNNKTNTWRSFWMGWNFQSEWELKPNCENGGLDVQGVSKKNAPLCLTGHRGSQNWTIDKSSKKAFLFLGIF